MAGQVTVLIVDDSPIMQKLLTTMMDGDKRIQVVGVASNGEECIQKTIQLKPQVILMDLEMPILDGVNAIKELSLKNLEVAVLLTCDFSQKDSNQLQEGIKAGAFDFFVKPKSTMEIDKYQRQVITKIFVASFSKTKQIPKLGDMTVDTVSGVATPGAGPRSKRYVVVGCSTGGKMDLTHLVPALPESTQAAIIVVIQQPAFIVQAFIKEMATASKVPVRLAENGAQVQNRQVSIVPAGDKDVLVDKSGETFIFKFVDPDDNTNHPSIDRLMESAATAFGKDLCGVILSGTGLDGLKGMQSIRDAKGLTLVQDKASCAVNQLPAAVAKANLAHETLNVAKIAEKISGSVK